MTRDDATAKHAPHIHIATNVARVAECRHCDEFSSSATQVIPPACKWPHLQNIHQLWWWPRPISAAETVELVTWFRTNTAPWCCTARDHGWQLPRPRPCSNMRLRVDESIPLYNIVARRRGPRVGCRLRDACVVSLCTPFIYTVSSEPSTILQSVQAHFHTSF